MGIHFFSKISIVIPIFIKNWKCFDINCEIVVKFVFAIYNDFIWKICFYNRVNLKYVLVQNKKYFHINMKKVIFLAEAKNTFTLIWRKTFFFENEGIINFVKTTYAINIVVAFLIKRVFYSFVFIKSYSFVAKFAFFGLIK